MAGGGGDDVFGVVGVVGVDCWGVIVGETVVLFLSIVGKIF